MIYEWLVTARVDGTYLTEGKVLATTEEGAKEAFEDQITDWSTGPTRFMSVEKTGMVLVPEDKVVLKIPLPRIRGRKNG